MSAEAISRHEFEEARVSPHLPSLAERAKGDALMLPPRPIPAKSKLVAEKITIRHAAKHVGCSEHYLGRVLNGWQPPSARVRSALAELLRQPESDLFDMEIAG